MPQRYDWALEWDIDPFAALVTKGEGTVKHFPGDDQ